jgi:small subunit ribosomal protein S21
MKDQNRRSKRNYKKAPRGGETQPVAVNDKFAHIEAVQAQPLEVKVYGNNFDKALRAFRALVQKERVLSTYKEKQSYEKPSDKRRRKRNESVRKQLELCSKGDCRHTEHAKNRKERKFKRGSSPE